LGEPVEELEEFELGDSKKKVRIGAQLPPEMKEALVSFLRKNKDVFAWSHKDMPGIPQSIIAHKLMVDPSYRPVKLDRLSNEEGLSHRNGTRPLPRKYTNCCGLGLSER